MHVISFLFVAVFSLKELDAAYFEDQVLPMPSFVRDNSSYIMLVEISVLFLLNVIMRSKLAKERRRLRHSASGLTDELENYLTANNG